MLENPLIGILHQTFVLTHNGVKNNMEVQTQPKPKRAFQVAVIAVLTVVSLIGATSIYGLNQQVTTLQSQLTSLQATLDTAQDSNSINYVSSEASTLSELYAEVEDSVVTIECTITQYYNTPFGRQSTYTSTAQGSGFLYEYKGQNVIITNNHVIEDASSITVTFANGNTYDATLIGSNQYSDIAVLSVDAQDSEFYTLKIGSSSTLSVGDSVVAIGSPYGLSGTMTTGIVSALDRTITVSEDRSSYDMTGLIQTSAPINSGNSGGPLMTYDGEVIGMTTAIVSDSDGLGFAVSSNSILSVLEEVLG